MTTAFRDERQDAAPVGSGPGVARPRGRKSRPRLPVTWPLVALFTAFPLWWVVGLSGVIWTIMTAPLLVALIWRQRSKAPVPIMLWFAFTSWVLLSGLQLESGTKIITFTYRLTLYLCGGLLFLYVYNLPRSRRLDTRVLHTLTTFWMIVVIGGYLGILGGSHTFPALIDFVLPHHLRTQPFVQELVQPVLANVQGFFGFPVPRPAAPFPYTNNWGGNIAVLTPVALAAMSATRARLRRRMIAFFLVASLLPMIVSLNRGMFLSLGVGLLYVAIRLAARGRVATLVTLVLLLIALTAVVALTPLKHLVLANVSSTHGNSNTTRLSVTQQAIAGANQSPLFGHGEPQAVTGQGGTPPIGTQGQLWMVLYSNGYVATVLFLGFFLAVLWQTRRAAGTAGLWLHAVPLIALTQITVYGWLPAELQVVMVVAALAYRRCWGSPPTAKPLVTAQHDAAPDLSGDRAPDRETAPNRLQHVVPDLVPELTGSRELTGRTPLRTSPSGPLPRSLVPGPRPRTLVPPRSLPPVVPPANSEPSNPATPAGSPGGVSATSVVVARGSLINLVAMVIGAVMSFGLVVLVSRWLQPHGAGEFYELVAMFTILSNTLELGADTGLTRWISRARAIGGLDDVRRIVAIAVIPVTVVGVAGAAGLWLAAPEVSRLFLHGVPVGAGATDIRLLAPLIPLGALSSVIVDGVRGFGRMWPYLAIQGVGQPVVRIVAVAAVLIAGLDLHVIIIVWGLPVIVGLVAGGVIFTSVLRKEVPSGTGASVATPDPSPVDVPRHPRRAEFPATPDLDATVELPVVFDPVTRGWKNAGAAEASLDEAAGSRVGGWDLLNARSRELAAEFWSFTGPRALQATFQVTVLFLDVLIVGALASTYQAGIYSAVSKLAILGAFALEGNRLAIGPQLSAMLGRREFGRAAELYQTATRSLVLLTFPLYLVLACFPSVILHIFGSRYTSGASALTVLCVAMLVNLGTGNVTVVLLMGGKSSWSAINAVAALIVNIGLNFLLVPRIGILGAAIAWSASIAIDNIAPMIEVRLIMGMAPFGRGYWRTAGITLACFGVTSVAARLIVGQTVLALAAALVAGLVSYALVLYTQRARLHLVELAAALRPGRVASPASMPLPPAGAPVPSQNQV